MQWSVIGGRPVMLVVRLCRLQVKRRPWNCSFRKGTLLSNQSSTDKKNGKILSVEQKRELGIPTPQRLNFGFQESGLEHNYQFCSMAGRLPLLPLLLRLGQRQLFAEGGAGSSSGSAVSTIWGLRCEGKENDFPAGRGKEIHPARRLTPGRRGGMKYPSTEGEGS